MLRIGINGFGRIGRLTLRIAQLPAYKDKVQVVAINSRSPITSHAHLLQFDSVYGRFNGDVAILDGFLFVNGQKITVYQESDPALIPWESVDLVLECTGKFRTVETAKLHLRESVKKVVISAPGKDVPTFVMGVNDSAYSGEPIVSNASCTTNCLAPVAKLLDEQFGIVSGFMSTVHAYTNDQNIVDNSHKKDLRRARAAAQNIIPTTTGAAIAVGKVLPQLSGKLTGIALRVPTSAVSLVDLTCEVREEVTAEKVNDAFVAAQGKYIGISAQPLVSSDFIGDDHSVIVDLLSTSVNGKLVKVLAWYDNEYGYACRLLDLALHVHTH